MSLFCVLYICVFCVFVDPAFCFYTSINVCVCVLMSTFVTTMNITSTGYVTHTPQWDRLRVDRPPCGRPAMATLAAHAQLGGRLLSRVYQRATYIFIYKQSDKGSVAGRPSALANESTGELWFPFTYVTLA